MVAVAVGCGRDPEAADVAVQPVAQTKDGQLADNQLFVAMQECWRRCENAYLRDSAHFMDVCIANNHAAFYSMTGISDALRNQIVTQEAMRVQAFLSDHPDYVVDSACAGCVETGLAMLGGLVADYSQLLREIEALDPEGGYTPIKMLPLTECEIRCIRNKNVPENKRYECITNCLLNEHMGVGLLHRNELIEKYRPID